MTKKRITSWGKVSEWYHELLSSGDTYQEKVILPNLLRIANFKKNERVLDVACGEGYFTRAFAKTGVQMTGADISPELITFAKKLSSQTSFFTASIARLFFARDNSFDAALCVLGLQNIEHIKEGIVEVSRVLKPGGRFIAVLNHPCFRIPKRSSWGFDDEKHIQYRRIDGYLSESRASIDVYPGKTARGEKPSVTYSFHRPLQVYLKAFFAAGFSLTRFEEWNSHKKSEHGPRVKAEDRARKEFPLFLCIVAEKKNPHV